MTSVEQPTRRELQSKATLYRRLTVGLAIVVVFLIIVVIAQLTGTGQPGATAPVADQTPSAEETTAPADEPPFVRRDPDDPMAIGDVDAPVVLTEWTDLRCPFCAAVHRDSLSTVMQEYVDKGLVRIEFNDVAFFGEQSEDAAVAARAAGEQGMFVEYLDTVFGAAPESGKAELPRERLIALAVEAGVPDIEKFTADLDDPDLRAAAQASTAEAQSLGITAVPFFVANGSALSGAQPVSVFRQFLDAALAAQG